MFCVSRCCHTAARPFVFRSVVSKCYHIVARVIAITLHSKKKTHKQDPPGAHLPSQDTVAVLSSEDQIGGRKKISTSSADDEE